MRAEFSTGFSKKPTVKYGQPSTVKREGSDTSQKSEPGNWSLTCVSNGVQRFDKVI